MFARNSATALPCHLQVASLFVGEEDCLGDPLSLYICVIVRIFDQASLFIGNGFLANGCFMIQPLCHSAPALLAKCEAEPPRTRRAAMLGSQKHGHVFRVISRRSGSASAQTCSGALSCHVLLFEGRVCPNGNQTKEGHLVPVTTGGTG